MDKTQHFCNDNTRKHRNLPSQTTFYTVETRSRKQGKNQKMADRGTGIRNITVNNAPANPNCQNFITYTVRNGPGKIIGLVLTFVLSYVLHHLLKPLAQPRIASDIFVSLLHSSSKRWRGIQYHYFILFS